MCSFHPKFQSVQQIVKNINGYLRSITQTVIFSLTIFLRGELVSDISIDYTYVTDRYFYSDNKIDVFQGIMSFNL